MSAWFPAGSVLGAWDFAVFGALIAAMTLVGWLAGSGTATADDYFLGGRKIPWVAAGLALVAAEVSALTILGVPSTAFQGDWTFLQFFLGAAAARVVVAVVFVPAFFEGGETPYAYLGRRFGPMTRTAGAASFLATRLLAAAVRLLAACVAAGSLLGWGPWPTLALFTIVSIVALARGGVSAAVWTEVFQLAVVVVVGVLSAALLIRRTDGGFPAALGLASAAGKLSVFDGNWTAFGAAALTGFLGSAAAFGTDHEMAQKLLSVKDPRESGRAMALSIAGSLFVFFLYMVVGTLLFVFFKQNPGLAVPSQPDRIFPHFAATAMPRLLRGLVVGAIVMASIDSPLASLATTFVTDLRRPFASAPADAGRELGLARAAAVAFALALAALVVLFGYSGASLSLAFKAGGVLSGPLLGIFLLGFTSRRRGDMSVVSVFMIVGGIDWILLVLSENGLLPFGWGWLIPFGVAATYAAAWLFTASPASDEALVEQPS